MSQPRLGDLVDTAMVISRADAAIRYNTEMERGHGKRVIVERRWNDWETYEYDSGAKAWRVVAIGRDSGGGLAVSCL